MSITVTFRNYRCFADSQPLTFELRPGFTGIVGPNSVGKSSLLRFFHEFRPLWEIIAQYGNFVNLLVGRTECIKPRDVADPIELFCNGNSRPLALTLGVQAEGTAPNALPLTGMTLTAERAAPDQWRLLSGGGLPLSVDPKISLEDRQGILHYGDSALLDLRAMKVAAAALAKSIYIGPFRTAQGGSDRPYYDLPIGGSFIKAWHEWKNGSDKVKSRAIHRVTEDLKAIFSYDQLEIGASQDLATLQVVKNGWTYRLDEVGGGFAQFVFVLGTAAMRQPHYIFIDEPELHLHPSLQLDFLTRLAAYASEGIVFSTHSIGLARAAADRVLSMRAAVNGMPVCQPLEGTPNYAEFLGEMSFTSFREIGVEAVLLVEGVTEVRTIQQFLRLLRLDHRVLLLPLGGAQMIRGDTTNELAEIGRIAPKVFVLIDSERDAQGAAPDRRHDAFVTACRQLGYRAHMTDRRAIENYFPERAIREELGVKYHALQPFERLREAALGWPKSDNWRIARQMTLDELLASDIGRFLKEVVAAELT